MNLGKIKEEIKEKEEYLTAKIEIELKDRDLQYKLRLVNIDLWQGFIIFSTCGGGPDEKRIKVALEEDGISTSTTYNSYTYMKAVVEIIEKLIIKEFEK